MGSQGDNPRKVLALTEREYVMDVGWSPDGKRLVYGRYTRVPPQSSIESCDLKGEGRTVIVRDTELELRFPSWLPDGRILYSQSEPVANQDGNVWQVEVDNRTGTPVGQPRRLTQWAGSRLQWLRVSADGKRLTFLKQAWPRRVYLGELAAGGTRVTSSRVFTADEANNDFIAWTADSKALFLMSDRNGAWGIFRREIGQETADYLVNGQRFPPSADLSPDGAWILYFEPPAPGSAKSRLMRVSTAGGVPQFVLEAQDVKNWDCGRAPAQTCYIYEGSPDKKLVIISAFDPLKARGRVLRTIEGEVDLSHTGLSPDGLTLAVGKPGEAEVRLISLSGGQDRVLRVRDRQGLFSFRWSLDGKRLYCGSNSNQGGSLLLVDLQGNIRTLWQQKGSFNVAGIPSPDGHYLAIASSVFSSNAWLLEGF